jgi:uncharacterized protein (DUF1499 family)
MKMIRSISLSAVLHAALTLVILMASIANAAPEPLLPPCPSSPNCVSSLAADDHFIEPLKFAGDAAASLVRLREILGRRTDTRIVTADEGRVQVEFRTLLGFVDDGLFVLDVPSGVIQVRSAARLGYWDLGKNRRRLEEIRGEFGRAP